MCLCLAKNVTNLSSDLSQVSFLLPNDTRAEFTTDKPLTCHGLVQAFTKPSELTGIIYEFIEREGHGFCETNVKDLMKSTEGL